MPSLYEGELQHTQEMQDIITAPPSWLLRWGTSVYFILLMLILILSCIIRYPDIIKAQLVIKSNNPTMPVAGMKQASISKILVKEGQSVKKGDVLACFEIDSNQNDVLSLLNDLKQKRKKFVETGLVFIGGPNESSLQLGEVEDLFQDFYLSYLIYKMSISNKSTKESDKLIHKFRFIHSFDNLINEIDTWKNKNFLRAPISGRVLFAGFIEKEQMVNSGQELFYIEPVHSYFFGVISIPQSNIGKVRKGQRVLLKLRSYPYEEFGMIEGKIRMIGDAIQNGGALAVYIEILENKRSRSQGIRLKNGMIADAEVITEELSVFKRITRSLIKILK